MKTDESLNVVLDVKEEVKIPVAIELAKWHAKSIEIEALAENITVNDDDEDELATSSLSKVKAFGKEVVEAKNLHIAPFERYVNRIKDMFAPISGSVNKAEETIKKKILAYRQDKSRKAAEEQARLEAERQKAIEERRKQAELEGRDASPKELELPLAPVVPKVQNTVKSGTAQSSVRKTWKARVTDPKAVVDAAAAGKWPIEAVSINLPFFNAQARVHKKPFSSNGIEYFEHEDIAAR